MKNHLLAYASAAVLLINGCKKGEEDPFFSVYSRDHRIMGTWKLKAWDGVEEIFDDNSWDRSTFKFDGDKLEYYSSGSKPVWLIGTTSLIYYMTIDKNGKMSTSLTALGDKVDKEGYWFWTSNNRKKDQIVLEALTLFTSSYDRNFEIVGLKNKELTIRVEGKYKEEIDGVKKSESIIHTAVFEKEK